MRLRFNQQVSALVLSSVLLSLGALSACTDDARRHDPRSQPIDSGLALHQSNGAGNLVATAVKDYYDVDIALIPSVILRDGESFNLQPGQMGESSKTRMLGLYDEMRDSLRTGTMRGSDLRDFLLSRLTQTLDMDLQVAGISFDLRMRGGWPDVFVVSRENGLPLENDRIYRVAISNYFYRQPFPGYYYGNNMSYSFNIEVNGFGSIKRALEVYLRQPRDFAPLDEPRGVVMNRVVGENGFVAIPQIQGESFLSPYLGRRVTTRGVITAVGIPDSRDARLWQNIPGRELPTEIIIQDVEGDGNDATSDGLSVFLAGTVTQYKVGQLIEVRGVVHEVRTSSGFSGTSVRMVESVTVIQDDVDLPEPVLLGGDGRVLRQRLPSSFVGDLNAKARLQINEGLDFWESLEGMRVTLKTPRVTGTRGGLRDFNALKQGRANYVEVTLVPEGMDIPEDRTDTGGNFYDPYTQDFNIESVKMVDGPFSPLIDPTKLILENGDRFADDLEGILSYDRNTFGVGRYVFYLTGDFHPPRLESTPMEDRPKTRFESSPDHLTVASWNVENLGGSERDRIADTARIIRENLKCPDIMSMPEIQDNNGDNVNGGSAADQTLGNLIRELRCPGADYRPINIDPIPFRDGGEFGGNIRVAMIYNANRVTFIPKGDPDATSETFVESDGTLNQNPGRVDPRNPALDGSRKPLVAMFEFKGQRIFVIGNHFNSMLGERSPFGAVQPYLFQTESKRSKIAGIVRTFVEQVIKRNPNANIVVAGDFNAYAPSNSMRLLAGDKLVNLMTAPGMLPRDQWYTSNYDGNSGAIDFIFASQALMGREPEYEILHINSNYMVKASDHDPLVSRFKF